MPTPPHLSPMTEDIPHPYSIEILELATPRGQYGWALRRSGKLIQRSDRPHASEQKAWASALAAVEDQINPRADRR